MCTCRSFDFECSQGRARSRICELVRHGCVRASVASNSQPLPSSGTSSLSLTSHIPSSCPPLISTGDEASKANFASQPRLAGSVACVRALSTQASSGSSESSGPARSLAHVGPSSSSSTSRQPASPPPLIGSGETFCVERLDGAAAFSEDVNAITRSIEAEGSALDLPAFDVCQRPDFSSAPTGSGLSVPGVLFCSRIDAAYSAMLTWRRNIFFTPVRQAR